MSRPSTIDPSAVSTHDGSASLIARTLCDSLLQLHPRTGELRPAIVESWQVFDGGRRFVLKLKKGVRFHSGQELNAEDVAWSLTRAAMPELASPVAHLLRPIYGFDEFNDPLKKDNPRTQPTILPGIEIVERHSVELRLQRRQADFLRTLTHPIAAPLPRQAAQAGVVGLSDRPGCAGPYRLTRPWDPSGDTVNLERFRNYYAYNTGFSRGGRGYPDSIQFRVLPDRKTEMAEFAAGRLAVAHPPPGEGVSAEGEPVQASGGTLDYIGLPATHPPFHRPEVRRALSRALGRRQLLADAGAVTKAPARGYIPPTVRPVYRRAACGPDAPLEADAPGARRLAGRALAELQRAPVRLYFNDEFGRRRLAEAAAAQWRVVLGVETELVALAWDDYLRRARSQEGLDGPFWMGFAAEVPSASRYLHPLFHSSSAGLDNLTRFASRAVDERLDEAARRAVTEPDQRMQYRALEKSVCRHMPAIPIAFNITAHVVAPTVGPAVGTLVDRTSGEVLLRELYLR